jgi:hypothetical protein
VASAKINQIERDSHDNDPETTPSRTNKLTRLYSAGSFASGSFVWIPKVGGKNDFGFSGLRWIQIVVTLKDHMEMSKAISILARLKHLFAKFIPLTELRLC